MNKLSWWSASIAAVGVILVASPQVVQGATQNGQAGTTVAGRASDAKVAVAKAFLAALLSRDQQTLRAYGPGFFDGGKLEKVTSDFLYTSDPKHRKRSVNQIADDGDIQIVIVPQAAGVVTVIYVPKKHKAGIKKLSFLEEEWMNKYFACEFDTTKPQWMLHYNFCFSETDGPYPAEGGGG